MTLSSDLKALTEGQIYVAPAQVCADVEVRNLPYNVLLDLSAVRFEEGMSDRGLTIRGAVGLTIKGFKGNGAGLYLHNVQKARVSDLRVHKTRGLFIERSFDVEVRKVLVADAQSDGINFNGVTKLLIEEASFVGGGWHQDDPFSTENQHPDAIQGWGGNTDVILRKLKIAGRFGGILIKDGANIGLTVQDADMWLADYKWAVLAQNYADPPKLGGIRAWGLNGNRPAFDLRKSPGFIDAGGNTTNGGPFKSSDILRK